jgi:hypothetical protein
MIAFPPVKLLFLGALLTAVTGCGSSGVTTVPVSGTVTFDGGPCPAQGNISFAPVEIAAGLPRRPGSASFGPDGQYAVTSFKPGDGLVPGRYRVQISCFNGVPDSRNPNGFRNASFIADDFAPPEFVVDSGSGPITKDFDVPLKKNVKR